MSYILDDKKLNCQTKIANCLFNPNLRHTCPTLDSSCQHEGNGKHYANLPAVCKCPNQQPRATRRWTIMGEGRRGERVKKKKLILVKCVIPLNDDNVKSEMLS